MDLTVLLRFPRAVAKKTLDRLDPVPKADLFPLSLGAPAVAHRNLDDPDSQATQFRGHLRAESEAVFLKFHSAQNFERDQLQTRGFVGESLSQQQIGQTREKPIAEAMKPDPWRFRRPW